MGFNGVRKHQKIEDPRFLYWADRLGLLVWEEMPSAYRFTKRSIERLTKQWMAAIARDASHPCIVAWVPFNESWGVPDLPSIPEQRHWVASMYHLTNTLDATRPVVGNDGWESVATDIMAIHDYDHRPERIARRYHSEEDLPRILERERPGGRRLVVEGHTSHTSIPVMLTEFGGIAYHPGPDAHVGIFAFRHDRGAGAALHGAPGRRESRRALRGVLLHAVHRHVSGGERAADDGPGAEAAGRGHREGHARGVTAGQRSRSTAVTRATRHCAAATRRNCTRHTKRQCSPHDRPTTSDALSSSTWAGANSMMPSAPG